MMITERLLEASVEIFGVVERTIAEYEEEVRCSKRENAHQRELLAVLLKPEIKLHRADFQKFTLSTKDILPEQPHCEQERSPVLDQENPEFSQNKEEVPPEQQQHCEQEMSPLLDLEDPEPSEIKEEVPPGQQRNCMRSRSAGSRRKHPEPPPIKEEEEVELWSVREEDPFGGLTEAETNAGDCAASVPASGDCFQNLFSQRHLYHSANVDRAEEEDAVATTSAEHRTAADGPTGPHGAVADGYHRAPAGPGDGQFSCHVCFKAFGNKSRLKLHVMTHSGAKSFGCGVCGKRFNLKHYLSAHMKVHTGEKPFKCSVCSNRFTHSSNLKTHMRTHTGEKPFNCSVCGKSFAKNINLKYHVMTHTEYKPFVCQVCGKGFYQLRYLKQHVKTHTVEKPYVCCVCGATFSQHGHLVYHMETHAG